MCIVKRNCRAVNPPNPSRLLARVLLIVGGGFLGWLVQGAGTWLVYHHSVYYRLSDAGFRFATNLAEALFFVGPAPAILVGLLFGVVLAVVLECRRGRAHGCP